MLQSSQFHPMMCLIWLCLLLVIMSARPRQLSSFGQTQLHHTNQSTVSLIQKVKFIEENLEDIRKVLVIKDKIISNQNYSIHNLNNAGQKIENGTSENKDEDDHHEDNCKTFKQAVTTLKEGSKYNKERVDAFKADLTIEKEKLEEKEKAISDQKLVIIDSEERIAELERLLHVGARAIDDRNLKIFELAEKLERYEAYKDILVSVIQQLKAIHSQDFDMDTFMERVTRSLEPDQVPFVEVISHGDNVNAKGSEEIQTHREVLMGRDYHDDLELFFNSFQT